MQRRLPSVAFKVDDETSRILDALTSAEGRSRSDVIRRALRLYGEQAGVVDQRSMPAPVEVSTPTPIAKQTQVTGAPPCD